MSLYSDSLSPKAGKPGIEVIREMAWLIQPGYTKTIDAPTDLSPRDVESLNKEFAYQASFCLSGNKVTIKTEAWDDVTL